MAMFSRGLRRLKKNQSGFTLVEMTVTLVLIGLICLGATMANAQIINQTSRNNDYTTATRQALNAVHWISRDAQMSHSINGTAGFPFSDNLTISWTEWNNTECLVIYSVDNNQLNRSYSVNGSLPEVTLVAEYINEDPAKTNCSYADGVLTIKITSTVGENTRIVNFTKEASISSRPQI
jgi:prepilin-type N-terminal cleavage/methylation domain-containing protein